MANDTFKVLTSHDNTFAVSDIIGSMISNAGCAAFTNRHLGKLTAHVVVTGAGTTTQKEVVWEGSSEFRSGQEKRALAMLDEMERIMKGNGDHNGKVVIEVKTV